MNNRKVTWQSEIRNIAKQFILEPNSSDYTKKDIERMIITKEIEYNLIVSLSEYLGYVVINRYGDKLNFDEFISKFRSKNRLEAYLKLHQYNHNNSMDSEDLEITELIIDGLKKGLKRNPNFGEYDID
jgi:aminoglycoside phosphotransferase family enzyme